MISRGARRSKSALEIPKIFILLSFISYPLSAYFLLSEKGLFTYLNQKRQIAELNRQIEVIEGNIKDIERRKALIRSGNREYLEGVFRRFGWVRDGEKIIKAVE